jgi:SAM-dependent methyltransferase
LESHKQKYDFISLLNVYSHLPDPPAMIRLCRNLLNPGGELLIQTGDVADLSVEEIYRPLYLPDHLSFASEQIISGILERNGFKVLSVNKQNVIPIGIKNIIREFIAFIQPSKKSKLPAMFDPKYKTNTFIRAMIIG